ncbi:hypothetical protein [Azohydromonas aeria]|uniref:hypothetical protein n=1 Tax=Azohydromonas aeria TaxID=2590212 RepID=UPI0012F8DE5C|nr:hypothetical protein [Azohydromonas aeria]
MTSPIPASRPTASADTDKSRAEELNPKDPMDSVAAQAAANPLGAGLGAAGGAAAGAAAGIAAGPVGSLAGAVLGTIAGALAGGTAQGSWHDNAAGAEHWRRLYGSRSYVGEGARYEDWGPAYAYGEAMYERQRGPRAWDDSVESELGHGWEAERATTGSALPWDSARHAARDAWERLHGAADNDPTRPGRDIAG